MHNGEMHILVICTDLCWEEMHACRCRRMTIGHVHRIKKEGRVSERPFWVELRGEGIGIAQRGFPKDWQRAVVEICVLGFWNGRTNRWQQPTPLKDISLLFDPLVGLESMKTALSSRRHFYLHIFFVIVFVFAICDTGVEGRHSLALAGSPILYFIVYITVCRGWGGVVVM